MMFHNKGRCRKGRMLEGADAEKGGCRKVRMPERADAGKGGCWKGQMPGPLLLSEPRQ